MKNTKPAAKAAAKTQPSKPVKKKRYNIQVTDPDMADRLRSYKFHMERTGVNNSKDIPESLAAQTNPDINEGRISPEKSGTLTCLIQDANYTSANTRSLAETLKDNLWSKLGTGAPMTPEGSDHKKEQLPESELVTVLRRTIGIQHEIQNILSNLIELQNEAL